jgi:cold shock protein
VFDIEQEHLVDALSFSKIVLSPGAEVDSSDPVLDKQHLRDDAEQPLNGSLLPRLAHDEPQFKRSPDLPVYSVVKWFNPKMRFGFVTLSDGSGEAFLHQNVLAQSGMDAVKRLAVLKVRIVRREDGRSKVVRVLRIDGGTTAPPPACREVRPGQRAVREQGTVKLYNPNSGYGFIARDRGGRDAFFHVSSLNRQKVPRLYEGQRVIMDIIDGHQGPKVTNLRLILESARVVAESFRIQLEAPSHADTVAI